MSYQDLSDRLAATWWYPVIVATLSILCIAVTAGHLAEARWGRALLGLFPIAFFLSETHRVVRAKLARRR